MYGVVGYYYYCSVHPTNSYLIARMHSLNMYVRSKYCRSTYAAKHQHVGQDRNQQKKKREKVCATVRTLGVGTCFTGGILLLLFYHKRLYGPIRS